MTTIEKNFTPSQASEFLFSLKNTGFPILQKENSSDTHLVDLILTLNHVIDQLGVDLSGFKTRTTLSDGLKLALELTGIRNNINLAESPAYAQTIFEYKPKSIGAHDYAKLIATIDKVTP